MAVPPRMLLMLMMCVAPSAAAAQDLTPRAYFPAPVASNAVILTYAYSDGELVFDPTLPITDAVGTIHTPVISLYHAFGVIGRSAAVTASMPYAVGDLSGNVSGEARMISRSGLADTTIRLAVNIIGGPALPATAFVKTPAARTVFGASVKVIVPTGQYEPTRLINIGANRWGVKPEVGYSGRVGKLVVDAAAGIWLFSGNESFLVSDANPTGAVRTQDPIAAFEFHLSYDIKPRFWISADVNYWRGGRTSVNGVESSLTLQANARLGITGSVPLTRHQSVKVSISDGVVIRIGGSFRVLSVGWQYTWVGAGK
jgi:hypothetical protein